jgi:hypothetical protein
VLVVPHKLFGFQDYRVPWHHVPSTDTELSSRHESRRTGLTCCKFIDRVSNCECLEHHETEIEIEGASQIGVYMEGNQHAMARNTCFHCAGDFYESVPRRNGESVVVENSIKFHTY